MTPESAPSTLELRLITEGRSMLTTRFFAALACVLAPAFAQSEIRTISTRTETSGIAKFIEYKKEVVLPGHPKTEISYLTDTRFAYTATTPAEIEDVAVVQFLRGCLFTSEYKNGKVTKTLSIAREHFGQIVRFQHRTWQIDSDSTDPIYSSDSTYGRFALLQWNADPTLLDPETSTYYAKAKPPRGTVFVTDLPGTAFLATGTGLKNGSAQNVSLELKTCLFKTADLPVTTTPEGVDSSKAIWCASWDHKYVWNYKTGQMESPAQIDPVCAVSL